MANNFNIVGLQIVTTEDGQAIKKDSKASVRFLAIVSGFLTAVIVGGFLLFRAIELPTAAGWVVGVPLIVSIFFKWMFKDDGKKGFVAAKRAVKSAVEGIADSGTAPSDDAYDKLIMEGKAIPLTVGGISGIRVLKDATIDRSQRKNNQSVFVSRYAFDVELLDDGSENFQRLLQNAIDSNDDIREAAAKAQTNM